MLPIFPIGIDIFESFVSESKSELWDSEEELINNYSNEENYQKLVKGEAGGNVTYKHMAWILAEKSQILIDDICEFSKKFIKSSGKIAGSIDDEMNEIKKYIKCLTSDSFKFTNSLEVNKKFKFKYDILTWLKTGDKIKLKDFYNKGSLIINFKYDQDQLDVKRDAINRYGNNMSGTVKLIQRVGGIHRFHRKAAII